MQPPRIDERDSRDLAAQLRTLMLHHAPAAYDGSDAAQVTDAMIQVFARFGEILIDRLNRVPEKNFLAFLQLLGLANRPPRAAHVPLTFYLAPGAATAVVPARTQVAAKQMPGETDPIVFETDQELMAVSNRLTSLFVKNGQEGLYSDLSQSLPLMPPAGAAILAPTELAPLVPAFRGDTMIPHEFYVACALSAPTEVIDRLTLNIGIATADGTPKRPLSLHWMLFVPPLTRSQASATTKASAPTTTVPPDLISAWVVHEPASDTTEGLTQSGAVSFVNVPAPYLSPDHTCWFRCSLLSPLVGEEAASGTSMAQVLPAPGLPALQSLIASEEIDRAGLAIDAAFFNSSALDITKDFYPLGEKPRFGDTLYLASRELFSEEATVVTLNIELTNARNAPGQTPVPKVEPREVKLAWEFWDGRQWTELGVSQETAAVRLIGAEYSPASRGTFKDTTSAFAVDGEVTFTIPSPPAPVSIAGQTNYWIRVRLVAGNYGQEAHRQREHLVNEEVPATFAPPMIRSVKGAYTFRRALKAQSVFTFGDFAWKELSADGLAESTGATVQPFRAVDPMEAEPALYFGFDPGTATGAHAAAATAIPRHASIPISMYVDAEESCQGIRAADVSAYNDQLRWEYWSSQGWTALMVRDDTNALRHAGMVRFLAPTDMAAAARFGCTRYWLRAVPPSPRETARIRYALLNTVMATGSTTYLNEDLGICNGMPNRSFTLLHKPVLDGQQVEILEPHMPGHAETEALQAEEGDDCIRFAPLTSTDTPVWVRWHAVSDFAASGPRDRHYLLDRLNGSVQFGDGLHGQIPPRGGKVRATAYRTGGGAVGNRPAGAITQLKTAVPSIASAWNWFPAGGGGNAEENAALLDRGPRSVRHGGRAVTTQDYEDLARQASPEVARARCVPLRDLASDPGGKRHKPGAVSLIVVPVSSDPRPMPSLELLQEVLDYLVRYAPPQVQLSAVNPAYIRVDVTAEVVLDDPSATYEVRDAVEATLSAYLHPLTGGSASSGWPFGSVPHKSELYAKIARVAGVSHVRSVETFTMSDHAETEHTGRFLVSPGTMDIQLALSSEPTPAGETPCR